MPKSKEDRLNENFELMLNDCINGNLFDFQEQVNKLSKKSLFNFMIYLIDNEVEDYIYKSVAKSLNKDYR